ncbi:uncharacterized protein LOC126260396 [Schistocerca nitens]|uniref:uncharacterized protein LOC126260396 n=1 Tax=Schistocerca nitens TaxID=7011 RepID=UPI0021186185|nr:uncharacterized protein LOC126260396 [Schistocerca nitens]
MLRISSVFNISLSAEHGTAFSCMYYIYTARKKSVNLERQPQFISDDVISVVPQEFQCLFLQSKTNSSPEFINYFKKYKLVLKRIIKEAKIKENDKYIMKSSNKTKSMWKAVQNLTGKKTTHKNIVISHDRKNVTDPREVANSFNSYYATVAGKLVKEKFGNPPNTTWKVLSSIEINNISMFLSPVSPTELLNTINSLKSKYSTGIDDIPDYIIKITARQILSPLLDICNSSLSCGFLKIIEKVFLSKLITFFDKNNIISGCQHGFRPQRSIETATLNLINHVLNAVDNHRNISGLFLDTTKAFDGIMKKILLQLQKILQKECLNGLPETA